jgi:hypothetical protein
MISFPSSDRLGKSALPLDHRMRLELPALVVPHNCDSNHNHCGDNEEYYLGKRYGLVNGCITA